MKWCFKHRVIDCPPPAKHNTPIDNCRRKDNYPAAFMRSFIIINTLLIIAPA